MEIRIKYKNDNLSRKRDQQLMLCLAEHYQEWKKERISREEKILEDFKIVRKFVPDDLDIQQIVQSLEENKIEKDDWIVGIINKAYNLDIYNLNTEKENK